MLTEFEKIEEVALKIFRGGEKETIARMFVDEYNKIMYGKFSSLLFRNNNFSKIREEGVKI